MDLVVEVVADLDKALAVSPVARVATVVELPQLINCYWSSHTKSNGMLMIVLGL